jgi:hypothetical protein
MAKQVWNSPATVAQARGAVNGNFDELYDKTEKVSPKRIEILNETTDTKGTIDTANFARQGQASPPIGIIGHNYTDADCCWLDNVGQGNTILRLNNGQNALRRPDKPSNFIGSGTYIHLAKFVDAEQNYRPVLQITDSYQFIFDGQGFWQESLIFQNNKATSTIPAFIYKTPSASHLDVLQVNSGGSDRKVLSIGLHASGILGVISVGSLMTNGLSIAFDVINTTQHLKYGTAGNPRTVPNVRTGTATPTVNAEFVGQEFIDTTNRKVFKAVATGTGANDWVALN